jgi:hypothetical protein
MKISEGTFGIAGILMVLACCGGCSTPGQKQAWRNVGIVTAVVLTAGAVGYEQYEINKQPPPPIIIINR